MSHETNALAQIHRQVMWNRLISVVEEQALTLVRVGFSTSTREAGDLSAGVFDLNGAMLAQAGNPFAQVLVDRDGRTGIDFGVSGVPETYLVGQGGRILAKEAKPLTADSAERLLEKADGSR